MRSLRTLAVLGLALAFGATCTGPTEPPPPPPLLAPSDTLSLDFANARTVDVDPIGGTSQRLVLELEAPQPGDSLVARLSRAGVRLDSTIILGLPAPGSNARQSVWIPWVHSDTALVLELRWIRRDGSTTVKAYLLPPNLEPEHATRRLAVGDTITEYLDGDTDEDWFISVATVDSRVTLWMQLDSASQPIRIQMGSDFLAGPDRISELTDSTALPLVIARDLGPSEVMSLLVRAVPGTTGSPAPIVARYRVWVEAIDRAPETAEPALVAGDTVAELIDGFGDVDRFQIPEWLMQEFRVFLARDSLSASPLRARLVVNGGAPIPFTLGAGDSVLDLRRSAWVQQGSLEPAILEVLGDTGAAADRGPVGYRLMYQRRARAPETAPVRLGLVDSVVTETLSSCADADDFEITGPPFTMVSIGAVLHGAPGCRVRVRLMVGEAELGSVDSLLLGTDTDVHRWAPLPIQASGVLRLRIEGIDAPGQPIGRVQDIGYTLDVYAVDTLPEIAPVELALGDSLVSETIQRCSDRDAFVLVGPPGTVVDVGFGIARTTSCRIAVSTDFNGSGFFPADTNEDARRFGHFAIPASGRMPVLVQTERTGTVADRGAPYFLTPRAVNTAPEVAPALVTMGDTIQETFSRCGDIDRYQVHMVAGEGHWLRFDRARKSSCSIQLKIDLGLYVGPDVLIQPGDTLAPVMRFYEAPTTGTYTFTVTALPSGHTDDRALPYSFAFSSEQNESAPSALALGDTSAIEPWVPFDLDLFIVPVQAGRRYVASTLGRVSFSTRDEGGWPYQISEEYPRGSRVAFTPTTTGDRRFRMGIVSDIALPADFRFMVHEVVTAPESAPDTLIVGDTSVVEMFEHPGDEDHFFARLTPGRYFRFESFPSPGTTGSLGGVMQVVGGDTLDWIGLQGAASTGRRSVPASGRVVAKLVSFMGTTDTTANPSYRVRFVDIDPAPESRGATVAAGDSIIERLGDPYDIDVFTFTVPTSGTYAVRFEAPASCPGAEDRLRLNIRVGNIGIVNLLSRTDALAAGPATLSASDVFILTVEAVDGSAGACLVRDYRVSFTRQP